MVSLQKNIHLAICLIFFITLGECLLAAPQCAVLKTIADVDRLAVSSLDELYRTLPNLKAKESFRFQLAREALARDPERFAQHVGEFNIRSTNYKLALLEQLAKANPELAVQAYDQFGIPKSRHVDALKLVHSAVEQLFSTPIGVGADKGPRQRAAAQLLTLVSRLPLTDLEKVSFFTEPLATFSPRDKQRGDREDDETLFNQQFFEIALSLKLNSPEAIALIARKLYAFSPKQSYNKYPEEFFRRNRGFRHLSVSDRYQLATMLFQRNVGATYAWQMPGMFNDLARAFTETTNLRDLSARQRRTLAEQIIRDDIVLPGFLQQLNLPDSYWHPIVRGRIEAFSWDSFESYDHHNRPALGRPLQMILRNPEIIRDPAMAAELAHLMWSKAKSSAYWADERGASDLVYFVGRSNMPDAEKYALLNEMDSTHRNAFNRDTTCSTYGLAYHVRFQDEALYRKFLQEHSSWAGARSIPDNEWPRFMSLSLEARIEALGYYAQHGAPVWLYLERLQIPRRRWMEVLSSYQESDSVNWPITSAIVTLNLTRPERKQLARQFLEHHQFYLAIDKFGLPEADRFDLALECASRNPQLLHQMARSVASQPFGLTRPDHQMAVVRRLLIGQDPEHAGTILGNLQTAYSLTGQQVERIRFSADPLAALGQITDVSTSSHVEDPAALGQLKRKMRAYAKVNPEILPPHWVDLIWDRIQSQETGFKLLDLLYKRADYDVRKKVPEDSLLLLSEELGYDHAALAGSTMSIDRMGVVYSLSLDIRDNLSIHPFDGISIDPQVFTKPSAQRGFTDFLQRARDYHFLRGNSDQSWRQVVSELNLKSRGITPENLAALSKELEQKIVDAMKELFKGERMELKYEDLATLEASWGDIGPVKTLVARFHGRPDGKEEIPVVARIFSTSVQGQFEQYKFEGHPEDSSDRSKAQNQLAVLKTDGQKTEWRRVRTRLGVYAPGGAAGTQAQALENARRVVRDELLTNLQGGKPNVPAARAQAVVRAGLARKDHRDALTELLQTTYRDMDPNEAKKEIVTAIGERILVADPKEAEQLAKRLRVWADILILPQQTQHDVIAMVEPLKNGARGAEASKMLVLTTTFHHPKMLLMVGDLVGTHTCQSYSTGGIIETLPGYVIDANIQGLASFGLNEKDFGSRTDFDRVVAAQERGVPVTIDFDAGKRIARFTFSKDGQSQTVTSRPLGNAYLRHIIKLGATDGDLPGIMFEPAKIQPSPAQSLMDQHAAEIKTEMATAIGGVADQKIKVVGSRNPHGVYSDRSGGRTKGDYEIKP